MLAILNFVSTGVLHQEIVCHKSFISLRLEAWSPINIGGNQQNFGFGHNRKISFNLYREQETITTVDPVLPPFKVIGSKGLSTAGYTTVRR